MCEAITGISYAAWALIAAAAGTGVAAKSAHDQSQYQGEVNKNNAKSAQFAAQDALDRGMVAEDLQRTKNRQLLAAQNAALAANGIDTTTGTGLNLLTDSAGLGEFDAQTVRANAVKQAYGLTNNSINLMADSEAARITGRNNVASSLLTGGSNAYNSYTRNTRPAGS
jgi:hypothetical protein